MHIRMRTYVYVEEREGMGNYGYFAFIMDKSMNKEAYLRTKKRNKTDRKVVFFSFSNDFLITCEILQCF